MASSIIKYIDKIYNKILSNNDLKERNIRINIFESFLLKGCSILIQFILVPLTLHYLDINIYGVWLTVTSIVLWLSFFDIGFSQGLRNKLTEALANNDYSLGKQLVSTTYITLTAIFIPLGIILVFIIPHINWCSFLNISEEYQSQITEVMYILTVCFCIQMIVSTISSVLFAYQKVALSNSFNVIGNFISIIFIYILTKTTKPSMVYLSLAVYLAPIIILIIASIYLYSNKLSNIRPCLHYFNKDLVKSIFGLGIKFFVINIQVIVMYQTTNILISNISSPSDVSTYNIAYRYIGSGLMILNIILTPYWPAFTDAFTRNDYNWMRKEYKKVCKVYFYILGLVILMLACSPIVYKLWIGNSKIVPWNMTISIAIYTIINSWLAVQLNLINGIGKIKLQTIVTATGMFLHIPLSLFLGKFVGAIGVVISMSILSFIYAIIFTLQLNKILRQQAFGIWSK